MTLTSEVDNILNGQVVSKTTSYKALGVSTANITPDEKGVAPLSKQGAFTVENIVNTQPAEVHEVAQTVPSPVEQTVEAQTVSPNEVVQETPQVSEPAFSSQTPSVENPLDNPQMSALSALEESTEEEKLENIEYEKPAEGVLTESPVDVSAPSALESFNFDALREKIAAPSEVEEKEPVVEEKIELPTMPSEIVAQEPTEVNNQLFANVEGVEPKEASQQVALDTPAENLEQKGPETTIVSENVVDSPFTVPTENQVVEEKQEVSTPVVENALNDLDVSLNTPVVEAGSTLENVTPSVEVENKEQLKDLPTVEIEAPKNEVPSQGAPEGPTSLFEEEEEPSLEVKKSNLEEKIDMLVADIAEIKEQLNSIELLINEKKEKITNESVLETEPVTLPDISVDGLPTLNEPVVEQTKVESQPVQVPAANLDLPTLNESLQTEAAPQTPSPAPAPVQPGTEGMVVNEEPIVGEKGYFV